MKTLWMAAALLPLMIAAGCTQLSTEDRALLLQSQTTAAEAKAEAARAAQAAREAADAAKAAAQDARNASDKADRMFARTQRKAS